MYADVLLQGSTFSSPEDVYISWGAEGVSALDSKNLRSVEVSSLAQDGESGVVLYAHCRLNRRIVKRSESSGCWVRGGAVGSSEFRSRWSLLEDDLVSGSPLGTN